MTWLLERVNELASGEVTHLSKATLDGAASIAEDFAMMRPILDTLLLSPVMPVQRSEGMQRSEGFCRALSAPLEQTTEVRQTVLCSPVVSPDMLHQHLTVLLCMVQGDRGHSRQRRSLRMCWSEANFVSAVSAEQP